MSNILPDLLNQKCVYWEPTQTASDEFGEVGYENPVELVCKWNQTTRKIRNKEGVTVSISDTVYLSSEIIVGGIIWRGELDDAPLTPPLDNKIVLVTRTDAVENDETLWLAMI